MMIKVGLVVIAFLAFVFLLTLPRNTSDEVKLTSVVKPEQKLEAPVTPPQQQQGINQTSTNPTMTYPTFLLENLGNFTIITLGLFILIQIVGVFTRRRW